MSPRCHNPLTLSWLIKIIKQLNRLNLHFRHIHIFITGATVALARRTRNIALLFNETRVFLKDVVFVFFVQEDIFVFVSVVDAFKDICGRERKSKLKDCFLMFLLEFIHSFKRNILETYTLKIWRCSVQQKSVPGISS